MLANSLRPLVLAAVASLALGGTLLWLAGGSGGTQEFADPGELRFRNVVIKLPPESSGLRVSTGEPITEGQKWVVRVSDREMQRSADGLLVNVVEIDADTGEVLSDTLSAKYPAEARDILATVRVDTSQPDLWPVADVPSPAATEKFENISYARTDPASGFSFAWVSSGCVRKNCARWLLVSNSRSYVYVNGGDGSLGGWEHVLPEDRQAFERFVAAVVVIN